MGTIKKPAISELKAGLSSNNAEKRTTIYLDQRIYKAAKQYAVQNDLTIKEYFTELLRRDLQEKGKL